MSVQAVLAELVARGVPLVSRADQLVLSATPLSLPATLVDAARAAKPKLMSIAANLRGIAVIDFETRSPVSLSKAGARAYIAHPDFSVICAAAVLPDGRVISWGPGGPEPEALFNAVGTGAALVAHNAHGFDRLVWEHLQWPEPAEWIDSLQLARIATLPPALEDLGDELLGLGKDKMGHKLMIQANRIDPRTGRLPELDATDRESIVAYCKTDAHLTRAVYGAALARFRNVEPDIRAVDRAINERGFFFDSELARAVIHLEHELVARVRTTAPVSGTILNSPKQLRTWLSGAGIELPDVQRATLEKVLEDPDSPDDVVAVLNARLMSSGITSNKLQAGLRRCDSDGRIRDSLVYYAARTGRWSGKGLQPQNLPRGIALSEAQLERLVELVHRGDIDELGAFASELDGRPSLTRLLGSLVRACIVAPKDRLLAVVDYCQIEARALLWLARDEAGLEPFRNGEDPYRAEVAPLFGVGIEQVTRAQRALGKVMVLGAGYGIGAERFAAYGTSMGVDWETIPLTPKAVVNQWRNKHPAVAGYPTGEVYEGHPVRKGGLWKDLDAAVRSVVTTGTEVSVGRCRLRMERRNLVLRLPSGRELIYRQPELRPGRFGKPQLTYLHGKQRVWTYGGKLAENITQAAARDVLATALVRLEKGGFRPVLHVHDEVVCEISAEGDLDKVKAICEAPMPWAEGLPLATEGYPGKRYRK